MKTESMRGPRLDKDFPLIKPATSQWDILNVLEGCNENEVRKSARGAGFRGETDILLIAPLPSPSSPQKNEALGLFYVGESSRRFGFHVEYWDERHENQESEFWRRVSRANTVGFTAITGFQLSRFVTIATKIKERFPQKPIILGGPHATLTKPEMNLNDPLIDFLVFGEGELRLPALLRAFYTGEGMGLVDGIAYKTKNGEPIIQPSRHVPDPARHFIRAVSPWTLPYFLASAARDEMILPTSRGCPWSTDSCDFCSVGKQYLDSYRGFPFELWKEDILAVHNLVPVRHLEPEDENSALAIKPKQPYLPFLKEIGATSHLHLRSDQLLDETLVKWLAEMGVRRIHIGVESGNERVLNQVMHKNEHVEHHYIAARNLAKYGIEMVGTYIVGNPTETWGEIKDTLNLAEELSKIFPKGGYRATIYVLAALPGTPIYHNIERMHKFNELLSVIKQKVNNGGVKPDTLRELAGWYRPSRKSRDEKIPEAIKKIQSIGFEITEKVADTVQKPLENFLIEPNTTHFSALESESKKWLWPIPKTLREWTRASAAYNPFLKPEWNAIYPMAGIHHNKWHKTAQNFPGWKRVLIKPFEVLCDVRYRFKFFKYSAFEIWAMGKLINWAAQRSIGDKLNIAHSRKVFESYSETLAGH